MDSSPALPATVDDNATLARRTLVLQLQLAYSGELGAARAYAGHKASLRDRAERASLDRILRDEIRHRHCIIAMLSELGAVPDARRERKLNLVGRAISTFCFVGGWFAPMYGAGRLEAQNVREYEIAARLAHTAGLEVYVEPLLEMAEVEWDHERVFRAYASGHPLWRVFPHWAPPPPREEIRSSYAAFVASGDRRVPTLRIPLLIR